MRKPLFAYIYWSENNNFKTQSLMPFKEFEATCKIVANQVGYDNGYDKTKVDILFSDGTQYGLRLDLSMNCDQSFWQYCHDKLNWFESDKFNEFCNNNQTIKKMWLESKDLINHIEST
jgi:hypothetical protein